MSEQELQFHYFKMHDSDNNNKLDGCELIKSLIHWHGKSIFWYLLEKTRCGVTRNLCFDHVLIHFFVCVFLFRFMHSLKCFFVGIFFGGNFSF